jgi:hypothetical protein
MLPASPVPPDASLTISAAAQVRGITVDTLRYYEKSHCPDSGAGQTGGCTTRARCDG